jgi:peptidoglycan L-alanyl-D-glutamate endopeptidase CwlK
MSAKAKWKVVQSAIGTTMDGIPGKNDAEALDELRDAALAEYRAGKAPPMTGEIDTAEVDDRSEKNIATLLEPVRPIARALVHAAAKEGITVKVISGTRTYAEQDALYAKGRTAPGSKVTNARGGYSNHNFGVAFDIGVFDGAKYITDGPEYDRIGAIGKKLGLMWGGDWTSFKDKPHFEYNPKGLTLAQMRERKANGQPIV